MKRWLWIFLAAPALATGDAPVLTVLVRETPIRKSPQFYAASVATARLGDKLASIDGQAGWFRVVSGSKTGWVHQSAVTQRKVKLTASGGESSETTADEVTLAGKGFNESVEGSYRQKHPKSNFAAVESLLQTSVSEKDVLRFVHEGALGGAE